MGIPKKTMHGRPSGYSAFFEKDGVGFGAGKGSFFSRGKKASLPCPVSLLPVLLSTIATVAAVWLTPWAALPRTLLSLTGIIAGVCAICVVAGVLEYRCWLHRIAKLARPLMRFSRLPGECALAFVASFASGNVAALMLAEKRNEGKITRREMISGALCNSIPPLFMFTGYLSLPVVGILGWAGVLYFAVTFAVMGVALLIFLVAARLLAAGGAAEWVETAAASPLPWREVRRKVQARTQGFLRRLLLLTVPFYLWTSCAIRLGWLDFTPPENWSAFLSPGALAVIGSRVGGLLAASGAAAELLNQDGITLGQLLIALLVGNILNGFTRLLRRGLPVSMGIYPRGDGAWIATASVGTRLALTAVAVILIWRLQA